MTLGDEPWPAGQMRGEADGRPNHGPIAVTHASGRTVRTLTEAFQETIKLRPSAVALRSPAAGQEITWAEYGHRVERIAAGLAALGVRRGDTLGIMLTNRPEFHLVDTAALHVGAVPFSIYNTSSPEQISHLFGNAENWVVVTERAFLGRIKESGVAYDHLVCVDDPGMAGPVPLHEVEANPATYFDFTASWLTVGPADLATIIYTSGTTGPPKGVELTHENLMAELNALHTHIAADSDDRLVSYLPAAHIADRLTAHYSGIVRGVQVTSVPDPRDLDAALREVHPTIFFGVPRVWQKMCTAIESRLAAESGPRRRLARWAFHTGRRAASAELIMGNGAGPRVSHAVADSLVLGKVRESLGLDKVRVAFSGAAPVAPELLAYFYGLGIRITEVWGMSETSGVTTTTVVDDPRLGAVGKPIGGMQVHIATDGELLVRGPTVMRGYRNEPEKTAEVLDSNGWLYTGDIATRDENGNIAIVDRKKEIIITEAGDNVAPANIENAVGAASPLIGQVVAVGEGMPYITALIVLDPEAVQARARALDVEAADIETLAARPGIRDHVVTAVRDGNATLSRPEQIKRFILLSDVWVLGGDELTPKGTVKRRAIGEKYRPEITALYSNPPGTHVVDLC